MEKETEKEFQSTHIDYKNIARLKAHTNPHARMFSRKRTGFSAKGQREFARSVKRARFMALLPFVSH